MLKFTRHIEEIKRAVLKRKLALVLFDFDGTLSPIAGHPNNASLPLVWRRRLERLAANPRITVGIVTGRVSSYIRRKASMPDIILASNHGYEIWRGRKRLLQKGGRFRTAMKALGKKMADDLSDIPGLIVEQKEYSVAAHYRLVPVERKPSVKRLIRNIARPYCERHDWEMMRGKEVVEIRPADTWNKGTAVLWILKHLAPGALPLYVGDDVTDEDAFRAIGKMGITIRVGRRHGSAARYFVEDIEEISPLVKWMIDEF